MTRDLLFLGSLLTTDTEQTLYLLARVDEFYKFPLTAGLEATLTPLVDF